MCGEGKGLLLIEGEAEEGELEASWSMIVQEYSGLIQTEKSASVFEAYKKMVALRWKMEFMELAVAALRAHWEQGLGHNGVIAEQVSLLGYDLVEEKEDGDAYLYQVELVEREAKSLVVFFNQAKADYEGLGPKEGAGREERDRMSYQKELALLSKFMEGGLIDAERITVLDYAGIVNYYLESLKHDKANG
jgi:hypothetical protein